ncbi:MAG: 2-vinyl bacteriochlorophyllide hydratase [Rhizobacter sp.]|nr:2-vinyl bacteriochlorophyllide hydratase [Chlorobiales bacterium]
MPRYTPDQLRIRNASVWTKVQFILAPIQFLVFIAGLVITILYYAGVIENFDLVTIGVLIKTLFLAVLFGTGAIWEKEVFGVWVFGPEFFWEDVGSTIAVMFHLAYFVLAVLGYSKDTLVWAAFAAYFSYLANAAQYLLRVYLEKRNERELKAQGLV